MVFHSLFHYRRSKKGNENIHPKSAPHLSRSSTVLPFCSHQKRFHLLWNRVCIKHSHPRCRTILLHNNNKQQLFSLTPCRDDITSHPNYLPDQQQTIQVPFIFLRTWRDWLSYLFRHPLDNRYTRWSTPRIRCILLCQTIHKGDINDPWFRTN
jgi:hypothetical protein